MDATGDLDLKLQKSAPELISELRNSLPRLLWHPRDAGDASTITPTSHVRRKVRQSKTDQLLKLLDSFHEWPQLLDPHLSDLLPPLVSAFIEYICNHAIEHGRIAKNDELSDIIPLSQAVCQILYAFCKVRGQKVIVRFLSNEPRYLEPMLDAFEHWSHPDPSRDASSRQMVWQERFVMLWWLAHLMLAPFDLASISSDNTGQASGTTSLNISLPSSTPALARRLVNVSILYLGSASKEKEAAAMLLACLISRPDMQSTDVQKSAVRSIFSLLDGTNATYSSSLSIHTSIGALSFLARLITTAEHDLLGPILLPIHELVERIRSGRSTHYSTIVSSALARKLLIKISRAIVVASSKLFRRYPYLEPPIGQDALGQVLDSLVAALGDTDTSVRIAASKALSLIKLELDSQVSSRLVSELLGETKAGTPVEEPQIDRSIDRIELQDAGIESALVLPTSFRPDFRLAKVSKWHGLIMTLSQFLFRRAIPNHELFILIERLSPVLQFEQRSEVGASVGSNVRDAACFGFWSLARRYTTTELSQAVFPGPGHEHESTLQPLANDLVVAACLDPAGNIRRGASAALQEMIGRHPDRVKHGIRLIQIVDYHAVALRSNAMLEVAVGASSIDETYWNAIFDGLLGWRGIRSSDAQSRRQAADTIDRLASSGSRKGCRATALVNVHHRLGRTPLLQFEERHGLLLTLAHIVQKMHKVLAEEKMLDGFPRNAVRNLWPAFSLPLAKRSFRSWSAPSSWTSNLILEGTCRLISAIVSSLSDPTMPAWFREILEPSDESLKFCEQFVNYSTRQADEVVIASAADAASNLFRFLSTSERDELMTDWVEDLKASSLYPGSERFGLIAAIGAVYRYTLDEDDPPEVSNHDRVRQWLGRPQVRTVDEPTPWQSTIIDVLLEQLEPDSTIELRCASLRSLTSGVLKYQVAPADITDSIVACMGDYTINQKGDVGSLVRVEAIKACAMLLEAQLKNEDERRTIIAKLGGLAVEKLDKVRWAAWNTLHPHLSSYILDQNHIAPVLDVAQTLSPVYFRQLLYLCFFRWARKPFLEGFITSAAAGSEALVQTSRKAFMQHTEILTAEEAHELCVVVIEIFMDNVGNDRLLLPTMEFLVFLFNIEFCQVDSNDMAFWQHFFKQLQSVHYKSTNLAKIQVAIKIYTALAMFEPMRKLALRKLCTLLTHHYAKVRIAAAESLMIVTEDQALMDIDWFKSPKKLKENVAELQSRLELWSRSFIATTVGAAIAMSE